MASPKSPTPDDVRAMFAAALSDMYRKEVPLYGDLLELVADINNQHSNELSRESHHRIEVERHGAIRLGTAEELFTMRRFFAVMDMHPVGYYDLTVAGLPVHATCFRPLTTKSLAQNPFRVFTSLLRLDLLDDLDVIAKAKEILARRQIFTPRCLEMIQAFESRPILSQFEAEDFIQEALETLRWHQTSTVDLETYQALQKAHPLVADVVCFRGPHLTPRVLDIEAAHVEMQRRGMQAKKDVEGPPARKNPILLRQTSFLALQERISFLNSQGHDGKHRARFGEIEQRGMALTPKGRSLYDDISSRKQRGIGSFDEFPDDLETLRQKGLIYVSYSAAPDAITVSDARDIDELVEAQLLRYTPITYEYFLPASAAGISNSNLDEHKSTQPHVGGDRKGFEKALGWEVRSEFELYEKMERYSLEESLAVLSRKR
ncbi:hypothetical protein PRZ48_006949 [Zasmidium cellare]|uniref:2-oxoadipate dioxygenase/decarboxylase n=1 Tax=Zasmidium cellare TaxID=395010 RepID=A0ABR0EK12_ZASCE|nr:hypothetical protein PRZ48_006949 [Zasmidium cellare]